MTGTYPMPDTPYSVGTFLGGQLGSDWETRRAKLDGLLVPLGLTGDEWHQSLYIFPRPVENPKAKINSLRLATADDGQWIFFTSRSDQTADQSIVAFPVSADSEIRSEDAILRALFIDVHSRLIAWWLTYAWRSQQLARATWQLGDSMQIIPAATCARSLLETAAALWVDGTKLRSIWADVKHDCAKHGLAFKHYHVLALRIWESMWGAKFDDRVPDLKRHYSKITSPNVLTLMDKFAKACDAPVQEYYQWLCNAVHPSIGGMLTFAGPMMVHREGTAALQSHAPFPMALVGQGASSEHKIESTIERAVVSAAVLSVDVLTRALDDTLRFIDDVALTTRAPQAAAKQYWRCLKTKRARRPCPCRSGQLGKACEHSWRTEPPAIATRFPDVPGTPGDR